jgi:hypothetical protein
MPHLSSAIGPAARGVYGARPYLAVEANSKALLDDIWRYLGDVSAFSRDDLMRLPTFSFVSLIVRYQYVCAAVHRLILAGDVVAVSRTELTLSGRRRSYRPAAELVAEFGDTVRRLVRQRLGRYPLVSVGDVVDDWAYTDPHLTENAKRVVVRQVTRRLVKEGALATRNPGVFARAAGKPAP